MAKVNAAGTALVYCGYIGGRIDDRGSGIAVDAAGNAYVTGYTASTEASFPVTVGPDLTYNGGSMTPSSPRSRRPVFLSAVRPQPSICAGSDAEYTVTVGALGDFDDDVILSASGHPAGSTAILGQPVAPPGSSVLTIENTGGAAAGSYVITVTGTAAGSDDDSRRRHARTYRTCRRAER